MEDFDFTPSADYDYSLGDTGGALSDPGIWDSLGSALDSGSGGSDYSGDLASWSGGGENAAPTMEGVPEQAAAAVAPEKQNALLKALGFASSKDGSSTDFSDPKSLVALIKGLGVGGQFLSQLMSKGKQQNAQSAQQLLSQQRANPYNNWNPTQAAAANRFFSQQYAPASQRPYQTADQMHSPIVPSRGYAEGGEVMEEGAGPMSQMFSGYVDSDEPGQADNIQINVSGGEYVLTPDVVASLGDGNNAAGAKVLDEWVQSIRERSRSPGPDEIQPSMQGEEMPQGVE